MKRLSYLAILALVVLTAALITAAPASATITTGGNNIVTLDIKAGTTPTFVTTVLGITGTVSCSLFSTSGTKDIAGDAVTGAPSFAGCILTVIGGSTYACVVNTAGNWSLESNGAGAGGSFPAKITIAAITITCTTGAATSCTIQIGTPQTLPTPAVATPGTLVWTNTKPGTLTATNLKVTKVNVAKDCFGIAATNVISIFNGSFSSTTNQTVILS